MSGNFRRIIATSLLISLLAIMLVVDETELGTSYEGIDETRKFTVKSLGYDGGTHRELFLGEINPTNTFTELDIQIVELNSKYELVMEFEVIERWFANDTTPVWSSLDYQDWIEAPPEGLNFTTAKMVFFPMIEGENYHFSFNMPSGRSGFGIMLWSREDNLIKDYFDGKVTIKLRLRVSTENYSLINNESNLSSLELVSLFLGLFCYLGLHHKKRSSKNLQKGE